MGDQCKGRRMLSGGFCSLGTVGCEVDHDAQRSAEDPPIDWMVRTRAARDKAGWSAWDQATEVLDAAAGDMPQPWRNATIALLAEHHPRTVIADVLTTLRCVRHSIRDEATNHQNMMQRAIETLEKLPHVPEQRSAEATPAGEKRDLHWRLTDITDLALGPAPTMPVEALLDRLEHAAPRIRKALAHLDDSESMTEDEDREIVGGIVEERTNDAARLSHVIEDMVDYVAMVRRNERSRCRERATATSVGERTRSLVASPEHVALWNAINKHGDVRHGMGHTSVAVQKSVVEVERALEAYARAWKGTP